MKWLWFTLCYYSVYLAVIPSLQAQIVPDSTLPVSSNVVTNGSSSIITGGTQAGGNLFHSFADFSLPAGGVASFQGVNATITNVISRVTGNTISTIDGRLEIRQTNGAISTANFFLLNPNGIVFGRNASLNIGGSFLASTADALNFANGTQFGATTPQATLPLLTVNVPIGLQFGSRAATIQNQSIAVNQNGVSTGLEVLPGRTLAIVGGGLLLDGGRLEAPAGRIELGSVASGSQVGLTQTGTELRLNYDAVTAFQDIQLSQVARVRTSGQAGGAIQVQGRRIVLSGGSQIAANTLGALPGRPLSVTASESVDLIGTTADGVPSGLFTQVGSRASGQGGDLTIDTQRLSIRDGAQVATFTFGLGNAGNLTVRAVESVDLIGTTAVLDTNGLPIVSIISSGTGLQSRGAGGNLTIETGRLTIQGGAEAQASTLSDGDAGTLTVRATTSVDLMGRTSDQRFPSGLLAVSGLAGVFTAARGRGGDINLTTPQLNIQNGAAITVSSTNTASSAKGAGNIAIAAQTIQLNRDSSILAETASGQGGNITLSLQDLLLLRRNSVISTTAGTAQVGGNGGNILIPDSVAPFLVSVGNENSDITANAFSGQGGNVTLSTQGIFGLVPRSRADLEQLLPNPPLDPRRLITNDITAISQNNPSLSGNVTITTPDVDPSQGLVALPINLVDSSGLIAQRCTPGGGQASNSFVATGRGGVPSNPTEPLSGEAMIVGWVALGEWGNGRAGEQGGGRERESERVGAREGSGAIVEAQGWVVSAGGGVSLVARSPVVTPHASSLNPATCQE